MDRRTTDRQEWFYRTLSDQRQASKIKEFLFKLIKITFQNYYKIATNKKF